MRSMRLVAGFGGIPLRRCGPIGPQQASYDRPSQLRPVADLGMMSAWFPPETGHKGQFYEQLRAAISTCVAGRSATRADRTKHVAASSTNNSVREQA